MLKEIEERRTRSLFRCLHPSCDTQLPSEAKWWHHLEDAHSVPGAPLSTRSAYRLETGKLDDFEHQVSAQLEWKAESRKESSLYSAVLPKHEFAHVSLTEFDDAQSIETPKPFSAPDPSFIPQEIYEPSNDGMDSSDILLLSSPPSSASSASSEEYVLHTAPVVLSDSMSPVERGTVTSGPSNSNLSAPQSGLIGPALWNQTLDSQMDIESNNAKDTSQEIMPQGSNTSNLIDAEENIWEAEELLAKWKHGKTTWYLVKWKDFEDKHNTWQLTDDISSNMISQFENSFQGNHQGVILVDRRVRRGSKEYLVNWMGRPDKEKWWLKEGDISRERVVEFETQVTREKGSERRRRKSHARASQPKGKQHQCRTSQNGK